MRMTSGPTSGSSPDAHEWVTTSTVLHRLSDFDDRAAWERFCERFHQPLQAFARKNGLDESESEDVAQESLMAFAEAYRHGEYDRTSGRLSSWLFGIAWRRIDHARRKSDRREDHVRLQATETAQWMQIEAPKEVSPEWEAVWERSMLEQSLRQVRKEFEPATFRVFEMIVLEHKPIEEGEKALGLSRNAIYIAKHRVAKRMRELLEECDEVRL
jgi:RNA polymerase sigma-70 factor (ECF subfamily)